VAELKALTELNLRVYSSVTEGGSQAVAELEALVGCGAFQQRTLGARGLHGELVGSRDGFVAALGVLWVCVVSRILFTAARFCPGAEGGALAVFLAVFLVHARLHTEPPVHSYPSSVGIADRATHSALVGGASEQWRRTAEEHASRAGEKGRSAHHNVLVTEEEHAGAGVV